MIFEKSRMRAACVMVVGCGALGNEVIKNLTLMGVGRLVLVDFDFVEEGNLSRSVLYRSSDVGKRKVDAAKSAAESLNPDIRVETIFGDVAYDVGLGAVAECDVVVGCVDSRWARYCIQRLCLRVGKSWVSGGIYELDGTVRVFAPGRNCYACSLGEEGLEELRRRMPCSGVVRRAEAAGHAPTTPIASSIIGAVETQEALKIVCGIENDSFRKMFSYDGESFSAKSVIFEAWDGDCPLHDDVYAPVDGGGLRWSVKTKVSEVCRMGRLVLNDPFVAYLENVEDGRKHSVMMPARRVEEFVAGDAELRGFPLSVFRTREYEEVDSEFPFGDLTLGDLGIPPHDILKILTDEGYKFVAII